MRRILLVSLALGIVSVLGTSCAVRSMGPSYSFVLSQVKGDTVVFQGVQGEPWNEVRYGCGACKFYVSEQGVHGPVEAPGPPELPGLIAQLQPGGQSLGLTCAADSCLVRIHREGHGVKSRRLERGRTLLVPTDASVAFRVSK